MSDISASQHMEELSLNNNCKPEQERIRHLNAVLSAIKDINRLIIRGKERKPLIRSICRSLVQNRGYHNAWIILLNEDYTVLESAEAGQRNDLKLILDRVGKNDPALWCWKVLKESGFMATEDTTHACRKCPVSGMYDGCGGMSARLTHNGKVYGILTVSLPPEFSRDTEEHALFQDVADDIAFALHSIEIEKERQQSEQALREARDALERRVRERTQELEVLSSRLISAQEEERKRIAGDLHDGIGQCLSAVKFMVETSLEQLNGKVPESDLKSLKALVPLLQEASEEVRTIVMNLRPSILDDLGILATIAWFCRQFKTIYAYIEIYEQIEIEEDQMPDPLKTILFRVIQEAMNNVAKHSRASRVDLILRRHAAENEVELVVQDNGRGFDTRSLQSLKASRKGFGITGMKERVELSGGAFSVDSVPEEGTTIRAVWQYRAIRAIS